MKKNDYFIGKCIDMTHDGRGVVKVDDFTYFVNGMIIDEVGKLKIIKVLKNYALARLIELEVESPYRINPKCNIFKACGGCHLQHLNSEGQKYFKTKRVKDCLQRIGETDVEVNECLMMEEAWYYRNKVQMPIGYKDNQLVSGFYKQHSNDIIACDTCYIQNKPSNTIIKRTKELMSKYGIKPYDKLTRKGNIKHILTKYGQATDELMLVFITNEDEINHIDEIVSILVKEFPNLKSIMQNINKRTDNVVLGDKEIVLYGQNYINDILLDNKFKISLKSFYQINPKQVEKLYTTAIEYAKLSKDDVVIDAYCGIGTIALSLSKYVKKVIGVEIIPSAINDAKENAKNNHIDNAEFICVDAKEYMIELAKSKDNIDVVFIDPPRKGCSVEFIDALIQLNPKKIIYISCDVSTQARDVKLLQEGGYKADICQPVDLFPSTYHVETVVRLSNQNKSN